MSMNIDAADGSTDPDHISDLADRTLRRLEVVKDLADTAHRETFRGGQPDGETTEALVEAVDALADDAVLLDDRAE